MGTTGPITVKSITEFHRLWELPQPEHPLISVVDYSKIDPSKENAPKSVIFDCYTIAIKKNVGFKLIYGQQKYDFDGGVMFFTAPNQLVKIEVAPGTTSDHSGWILFIHPDFLW